MATSSGSPLALAEQVLRSWEPAWTGFLAGREREAAESQLAELTDLSVQSEGGYPGAERRRLLLQRQESSLALGAIDSELLGLEISGNFLFDPASAADFRQGLLSLEGVDPSALGDIWVRGDRGAQASASADLAQALDGCSAQVRSVAVALQARPLLELQVPAQRAAKRLSSVEASLRIDAVASAGFGVSRSRMAARIRLGELRLNWQVITSPSRELHPGDRVRWSGHGELTIEAVEPTKRQRWRVVLLRN